jgi:hypothetical protein
LDTFWHRRHPEQFNEFVKIDGSHKLLMVVNEFLSVLSTFIARFEVLYETSVCNVILGICEFHEYHTSVTDLSGITFTHVVKPYDFLELRMLW